MKKTYKKIFGLFGLILVIAVTIFAVFLPESTTKAITEETDTIKIRVVGSTPSINISGITSGDDVVSASQGINIDYSNIDELMVKLKYTDIDGNVFEKNLIDGVPTGYIAGNSNVSVNLQTGEYSYNYQYLDPSTGEIKTATGGGLLADQGFGEYVITVAGEDIGGVETEKSISFSYVPVTVSATQDGDNVNVDLNYDKDGTGDAQIGSIVINVYDETGQLKEPFPITIYPPNDSFTFNPKDYGFASGTYRIEAQAYDTNGAKMYKLYRLTFDYQTGGVTPTPNTGGVMGNLNISKTDYIITGLIIFSIVGISGAVFISKHDKKTANKRRK